jgi:hypothetical protein
MAMENTTIHSTDYSTVHINTNAEINALRFGLNVMVDKLANIQDQIAEQLLIAQANVRRFNALVERITITTDKE